MPGVKFVRQHIHGYACFVRIFIVSINPSSRYLIAFSAGLANLSRKYGYVAKKIRISFLQVRVSASTSMFGRQFL